MSRKIATMLLAGTCAASMAFGCMGTTSFAQGGTTNTNKDQSSSKKDNQRDDSSSKKDNQKDNSNSNSNSNSKKKKDYGDAEDVLADALDTIYDSECIGLAGSCTVTYSSGDEAVLPSYILASDDIYMEILTYEDDIDEAAYLIVTYPEKKNWTQYVIPAGGSEDDIQIDTYDFGDLDESGYSIAIGDLTYYSSAEWEKGNEGKTIEAEMEDYDESYTADIDKNSRIERFETSFGSEYEVYYDDDISFMTNEFIELLSDMEPDDEGYIESFREGIEDDETTSSTSADVDVDAEVLDYYIDKPIYWCDDVLDILDEDSYSYDEIYEALDTLDDAIDNGLSYFDSDALGKFSTGYDDNCYAKVKKGKTSSYILLFYIPEADCYAQVEVSVKNKSKSDQFATDCVITSYSTIE